MLGITVVFRGKNVDRGDTIVEVMFAAAVLGLVIVLSMSIMNRGVATTQMAVEHTLVRQYIDGQADALRYLRDYKGTLGGASTASAWSEATNSSRIKTSGATSFGEASCSALPTSLNAFYIDTSETGVNMIKNYTNSAVNPELFAVPGKGMWVEAVSPPSSNYIDFHIRACWEPPFSGPSASLGTIVRLTK